MGAVAQPLRPSRVMNSRLNRLASLNRLGQLALVVIELGEGVTDAGEGGLGLRLRLRLGSGSGSGSGATGQ